MADWDPFADPGDDATLQETKPEKAPEAAPSGRRKPVDDIFAAFRSEETVAKAGQTPSELSAVDPASIEEKLDKLFSISDDDVESLRKQFASLATLAVGSHFLPMWRRSLPLLELQAPCKNLLGLMIDDCLGFLADPSSNGKNATYVDVPAAERSSEVVFLLAWGGGHLSDMQDLVEWYREIFPGCTIFISTSNQKQSFGLRCQCARGIRAAADAWSLSSADPKLLVHLFSNSGMHAWTELLQSWNALSGQDLEEQGVWLPMPLPAMSDVLRGVILDSAPDGAVTAEACIQSMVQSVAAAVSLAVSTGHDGSPEKKKEAETASKRAVSAIIGGNSIVKAYLRDKPEKMLTKLASSDTVVVHALEPPVPMQFIYSKDDNIILAQGVERYLQEVNERPSRKGLALPRVWCLEKSRHCFHKLTHQEEYRKCVKLFASSTMT